MKKCPSCQADYFDNRLEFCLDDGTRLLSTDTSTQERPQAPKRPEVTEPLVRPPLNSQETVVIGPKQTEAARVIAPLAASSGVPETAALVLALLHNWWQWIYIEKVYISSIAEFLLSANFLMWLLLLSAGTAVSIYSIKVSRNRTLAIISLVTLAINLILFLVPRR